MVLLLSGSFVAGRACGVTMSHQLLSAQGSRRWRRTDARAVAAFVVGVVPGLASPNRIRWPKERRALVWTLPLCAGSEGSFFFFPFRRDSRTLRTRPSRRAASRIGACMQVGVPCPAPPVSLSQRAQMEMAKRLGDLVDSRGVIARRSWGPADPFEERGSRFQVASPDV